MEWLERLNQAVGYIEDHLEGDIDYDAAAHIACCSTFHFQRMFSYIAGIPLSEYIRRRRMTCAGLALQRGEDKVIDLALRYGYDSPTAFTRAFTGVHGMPPSEARRAGATLKAYPRISFRITIKGDTEMNYRIEQKEAFRIVGAKRHYCLDAEASMAQVPLFWREAAAKGTIQKLCTLPAAEPGGIVGVCTNMIGKDFDYFIACATDAPVPDGMEACEIPACTWAIFECTGPMPDAIQNLQRRVIAEWLPASGYEYADAPDIEVYTEGDMNAADYRSEVWLPIVKKA